MSDGRLDRSPTHHQQKAGASVSYPVRRMRNTAVLVKWIEEHQSNPYPTKAEKQYLAYYSGMNLTQLSTWFANARRRIKKIGMKTWLEGRSTFTVDFFPSTRPTISSDTYSGSSVYPSISSTPYAYTQALAGGYTAQHTTGLPSSSPRLPNGGASTVSYTDASAIQQNTSVASMNGFYSSGTNPRPSFSQPMMTIGMHPFSNWPMASATPLLPSTSMALQSRQGRHSPVTAQVYTSDLRTHSAQSLEACDGTYSLPQHSPDQIMPECASSEPNTA